MPFYISPAKIIPNRPLFITIKIYIYLILTWHK